MPKLLPLRVAALNKEWLGEGPTSSDFLDGLGVLVRNFDSQSDPASYGWRV